MLAAVERGWGGPRLLDAYEAERRPIGRINRDWAEAHTGVRLDIALAYLRCPDAETNDDDHSSLAAAIAKAGNLENEAYGLEFAYRYDASPLIAPILANESGQAPANAAASIPAAAWPGMRAPSFLLDDGSALFDRLDPAGFTLLRFVARADAAPFLESDVPVRLCDIDLPRARDVYGADFALIRPDGHLAWRGPVATADALRIARGAAG